MFCPNVLANCHADFFPVDVKWLNAVGGLEVALLVEDIISGQERFVYFADRLATLKQRSGVAIRLTASFVPINKPDQQRRLPDACVQLLQYREILRDEPRLKNQVLRRVSGDRQLWSQH